MKAFIEVCFVIQILVVQDRDLVPSQHMNFILHNFESQGLKQTGRKAFPLQVLQVLVDPLHQPDIAMYGGDSQVPIIQKVVTADEKEGSIRIFEGNRNMFWKVIAANIL